MEMDQLSPGSLFSLAVATTILLWFVLRQALGGGKDTGAKHPPGPWNLPIIGSLHHLVIGTRLPPHRALLRLSRRHGPLMLVRLGEVPKVIVSSPEAAMEVLKTNDLTFATRPSGPTMDIVSSGGRGLVFAPYGEHWRQMRKVCVVEVLSARQVRRIESIKQDEVARLLESVAAASAASPAASVDVGERLARLTNNVIARAAFGGECRQQEAYLRELARMSTLVGGFSLVDLFPSSRLVRWLSSAAGNVRRSHARVQRILGDIIRERQEKKPNADSAATAARDDEDLLDVLLRLHKEDALSFSLTPAIISAVIFDIFGAATDTTAATIEWAMAELIRNPHAMARAKLEVRQRLGVHHQRSVVTSADLSDLHYLRMVIKETLRLHPPGPMIHRACQEDCQVMGYDIPKGTAVMINAFAVGRDPAHWGEDAVEFRPERFEEMGTEYGWQGPQMEFIPFGAGRRQCPGALLATTTIELVLANLLHYFDWAIPGGAAPETLDMGEVFGIIVRTRSSLFLKAVAACHLQDH
ncbi:zealexin A1 synthase-like [Lolium rigidum]|uniref:zealexin A1 synthase-like n=1 Tax=Lolium rigidum TaxID=89674 RepID=UPI001F5D6A9F|nr:zealexin A1 synthase-like [Lolium rigidum]